MNTYMMHLWLNAYGMGCLIAGIFIGLILAKRKRCCDGRETRR